MAVIEIGFYTEPQFDVDFGTSSQFDVEFGEVVGTIVNPYTGEYESTPSWKEQVFKTNGLSMTRDFTVHSITKQEAPNAAGGLTLSI